MKERLDVLLVNLGYAPSREKAKAVIMSGCVYVNGQKEDKAGTMFDTYAAIEVRGNSLKYVSRGGLKLEKAMEEFAIALDQKTCMDVGASTGGFTDCMLQNGAVKVFAVDVGHGQLAWSIGCAVDFVSIDVSFISLTKVLVPVKELMAERGQIVCLIKPQFEAGREKVGKKGVVREKETHMEVVRMVMDFALSIGFGVLGLAFSPIKGPEGNIEYLLYLQKTPTEEELNRPLPDVKALVEQSHELL